MLRKFWKKEQPQTFGESNSETVVMLGQYADELLRNPAFDAACNKAEADLFNAWKTSAPKDEEAREHLYYRMEGLAQIRVVLNGMINNMKFDALIEKQKKEKNNG